MLIDIYSFKELDKIDSILAHDFASDEILFSRLVDLYDSKSSLNCKPFCLRDLSLHCAVLS
jgi:hypothetical protein